MFPTHLGRPQALPYLLRTEADPLEVSALSNQNAMNNVQKPRKRRSALAQVARPEAVSLGVADAADAGPANGLAQPQNVETIRALDERHVDFLGYVRDVRQQSAVTLKWYAEAYRIYRAYLLTAVSQPPDAFAAHARSVEGWLRWIQGRPHPIQGSTLNAYFRGLRRFFKDVEERDGVPSPFAGVRAPGIPAAIPRALEAVDCRRILDAAFHFPWPDPRDFRRAQAVAVLGVMLYAGLRRSEVLHLGFADVDLAAGTLRVTRGKGRYGGKDRIALIAPDLAPLLRAYVRERRSHRLVNPEFFSTIRGVGLSETTVKRLVDEVKRASGVRFSPHVLRHSFVTHLLRTGVPIQVARDLAGHSDIGTTLRYTRIFDEDRWEGIRKLRF